MQIDIEALSFDFSKTSNLSGVYFLANCLGYNTINIQLSWSGLNGVDAFVKYAQKNDVSVLNWDTTTIKKVITLTTTADSEMISVDNFNSKLIALYINRGSVTTGVLKVRILTNEK